MNKIFGVMAFLISFIFIIRFFFLYPLEDEVTLISKVAIVDGIDSTARSMTFNLKIINDPKEYYAFKFVDDRILERYLSEGDTLKITYSPNSQYSIRSKSHNLHRIYSIYKEGEALISYEKTMKKIKPDLVFSGLAFLILFSIGVYMYFFNKYLSFNNHIVTGNDI